MMDQYGATYTANGIGLETVKAYERLQVGHTALLDMVYGPDGETPVEEMCIRDSLSTMQNPEFVCYFLCKSLEIC